MVIKNRAERNPCRPSPRTLAFAYTLPRRVIAYACVPSPRMYASLHLRPFEFCAIRIHFGGSAAEPLSRRGACGSRSWRGNNSRVQGVERVGGRQMERKEGKLGEKAVAGGEGRLAEEHTPPPRGSLRKVQRYKAPVIYFGLPWLLYPLVLVRSSLEVFKRASNETTATNKHRVR